MNKHITYIIAIFIFGSLLACTTAKDKNDIELGNIDRLEKRFKNLAEYFSELRQEKRLPGIENEYEIKTFSVVNLLKKCENSLILLRICLKVLRCVKNYILFASILI